MKRKAADAGFPWCAESGCAWDLHSERCVDRQLAEERRIWQQAQREQDWAEEEAAMAADAAFAARRDANDGEAA